MGRSSLLSRLGIAFSSPTRSANLGALELELSERFESLAMSNDCCLNLSWFQDAMSLVTFAHSYVQKLMPQLHLPLTHRDFKWLDQYLNDDVRLLDVCKSLEQGISELQHYQMLVHLTVRSFQKKGRNVTPALCFRAKNALKECISVIDEGKIGKEAMQLESCCAILRKMGDNLGFSPRDLKRCEFIRSVHGAKLSTIFILSVLSSGLSMKRKRRVNPNVHMSSHDHEWASSLAFLQQKVREETSKKRILNLKELNDTHVRVLCLYDMIDHMRFPLKQERMDEIFELVEDLRRSCDELEKGLIKLKQQVGHLIKILVATRIVLLDIGGPFLSRSVQNRMSFRVFRPLNVNILSDFMRCN